GCAEVLVGLGEARGGDSEVVDPRRDVVEELLPCFRGAVGHGTTVVHPGLPRSGEAGPVRQTSPSGDGGRARNEKDCPSSGGPGGASPDRLGRALRPARAGGPRRARQVRMTLWPA